MRWKTQRGEPWRRAFVILPMKLDDTWYWLEWGWRRFYGTHYQWTFEDPNTTDTEKR